jgi:excisionase family DNA binding protein
MTDLLTTQQVADLMGCTIGAVYHLIERKRLEPHIRGNCSQPHQFKRSDVQKYMAERNGTTTPPQTCRTCAYRVGDIGRCLRHDTFVGEDQTCNAWVGDGWRLRKRSEAS